MTHPAFRRAAPRMSFRASLSRSMPAATPLALAAAIAACHGAPALAQSAAAEMPSIVVTGARFDSDPALTPIGATIITADQIRRAGAGDVNAAIRKIGGVYGRQSLDGGPDFSLDLRGFGTNSSQNMVVVLDGVRLSDNELANATLSTIPIDSVDHIEITRGGSSVLYGEGATGGIINIVSKRPDRQSGRGTVYVEAGQLGQREGRASAARTWDGLAVDATVDALHTDNYRDNNAFKQYNFSGGAQWFSKEGRAGVRVETARQDQRLAGALTEAQYQADPRQTLTPDDFGSLNTSRVTGFVERHIGSVDVAAELSQRDKTARASYFFGGVASPSQYNSKQTQFSPRLRQTSDIGGMLNEVVAGIDLQRWERETVASFSQADATQHSKALYARDEIRFDAAHNGRLSAGVRREIFDKDSFDPAPSSTATYHINQALNAWDLQASYAPLSRLDVYAKAGQSYRLPNADENGYTPQANVPLAPQVSHDVELGASYGDVAQKITARVFRHQLHNEIFYDPTANGGYGANTNLDPTKRQGFELDADLRVAANWNVSGHYQHVQATFTQGPNAGRELVLVPKNVLTARLSWTPADGQSADIGAQWADRQRYGSDFDNSCAGQMPSFTTFDGRYARKFGQWELALIGLNLADKQYFSEAYACKGGIYPSNGRQMKVSARYDF
ncbi:TonB-dependent receptor [Rugamonas sp.]|uniref:TonB-dependent receptor n=1 Tax=Rugamonas sp. TaxID=1926287 RepID=UPI0025E5C370|nr:TonB-dependent receptor [Rugamonas sp.]